VQTTCQAIECLAFAQPDQKMLSRLINVTSQLFKFEMETEAAQQQ